MYEFGVDFIARCLAGEAINEAKKKQWKLIAGQNITLLDNLEDETTTISADTEITIDDQLSLVSENPVQNKVITDALQYKPDTIMNGGVKVANQKIMQLTKAQFDAIENKDPNTYYMVTDDADLTVRTAYVDMTQDCLITVDSNTGSRYVSFEVPETFTMIEARINYEITWTCGAWNNQKSGLTSILTITPSDTEPPKDGRKTYMGVVEDRWLGTAPNQTHVNEEKASLIGANYITYDNVTKRIRIEITKPTYNYINTDPKDLSNINLTINNFKVNEVGYIAYGSDNIRITEDSYTAGEGISINENGVISIDAAYGASFELSIDPSTYVITAVLKDQDGTALSTQTIDLPLESLVVSGSYDSVTKTIILTLDSGDTISIPIGDLVSGLESVTNKVTSISDQSTDIEYPSAKCVYDAITAVPSVPAVTSSDNNKVLTADYTGNTGSFTWEPLPSPNYADATNKPSINSVTLSGNKTAADLGLVVPSDLNDYLTTESAANTYQTKAGMSSYLTTTQAAQDYLSKTDAASTYLTISDAADDYQPKGNYQPAGNYATTSDIADMATETWVGQQGFETATHAAQTYQTKADMSDYLTNTDAAQTYQPIGNYVVDTDIADMATETWVSQQGFETAAHANATYQPKGNYVVDTDIADMATMTWVGLQGYETSTHAAQTYQTQAAMSNFLTNATAASTYESQTHAAQTYQPKGSYVTQADIADMATETWVGQQGFLTSSDVATVATTGDYDDLTNKPTIPAAQVNADWNASTGVAAILNKPTLGTAAAADTTDFATAAQGAKADTAVQPADLNSYATQTDIADMATETWVGQQGFETSTHAASTYQTQAGMSSYLTNTDAASTYLSKTDAASTYQPIGSYQPAGSYATTSDIVDMATETWIGQQGFATETWVGQQGYLTDADEVPTVGSGDNGKILTATYSGGVGSYSWEPAPQSGTMDYSQLNNKPSIEGVTLNGNKTAADLGLATTTDIADMVTTSDIADMATKTWVGQQGFLTSADEVPAVGSSDDGKVLTASYSGGTGSYSWQPASSGGSGLQVETDGTNYWITVNGIRLYFASSAPTGTIPNGSMGIGW